MKRLWTVVPPSLSDLMGFQAVMNATQGLGIIDDAGSYKLRCGDRKSDRESYHGHHSEYGRSRYNSSGRHNTRGKENRVLSSDIRNEDIINGTEDKVIQAAETGIYSLKPDFTLLSCGPSASMIGSDLMEAAEQIENRYHIPSGCVDIHGEKDYLYGISRTLEAMGKLLLKKQETRERTVNIIGMNPIDWTSEECMMLRTILEKANWTVLSVWGMQEKTSALRLAGSASMNLVVSQSGLRLAEYMQREYGISYVSGAPFGERNVQRLMTELEGSDRIMHQRDEILVKDICLPDEKSEDAVPEILIIGEQFTANAIRNTLQEHNGETYIRVLSFSEMGKAYQCQGDRKISDEKMLEEQLNKMNVRMVIANPDYKPLLKTDVQWLDLPSPGFSPVVSAGHIQMLGKGLDHWLEKGGI